MKNAIACLFLLNIAVCYGQFEKNICVGDVEIAFSTVSNNFKGARSSCQSFGGDLVKIESAEIQTAIQNTVVVKPQYFIGAYATERNNIYHWVVDNTSVPGNPQLPATWSTASGYQNWNWNQPNNVNVTCVALGVHYVYKWSDVHCGGPNRYICQRDLINITIDLNFAVCKSTLSTIEVRWEKNSVIVQSSDTARVYQTIETSNSTIYFVNANISEAGTYTCVTTNTSCYAQESFRVNVNGTPTIHSVENNKCNASLFVTWKPHKAAVGFYHRFTVNGTNSTLDVLPNSEDSLTTEIIGLELATSYYIQIRVCEANNRCNTSLVAEGNGTTDGVTDEVTAASLRSIRSCVETRETSDSTEDQSDIIASLQFIIVGIVAGLLLIIIVVVARVVIVRRRQTGGNLIDNTQNGDMLDRTQEQGQNYYGNAQYRDLYEEINDPRSNNISDTIIQNHTENRLVMAQMTEQNIEGYDCTIYETPISAYEEIQGGVNQVNQDFVTYVNSNNL